MRGKVSAWSTGGCGCGSLGVQEGGEAGVEFGGVAQAHASLVGLRGEAEIAGEQGGGGEDVVKLGKAGIAGDGALDAAQTLVGEAKVNLGGAEFGEGERGGFALMRGGGVGGAGFGVSAGLEARVAEGLPEDRIAEAEFSGAGETAKGFRSVAHADEADSCEEPGDGVAGAERAGLFEQRKSCGGVAEMLELPEAEFEEGLGIAWIGGDLLLAQ